MRLKDKTISANTGLDAIKRAPIVDYDTGLKCIRIQDISQGKQYDEWGFTETTDKDRKKFLLKKDDLLIARTGATVGVSQYIKSDIDAVYNNGTIRLRFENSLNPRFVYYIFQTNSFLQYIDNISCVATQPNLRIEGLLRFTIPDYSIERQNKIAEILSSFDELIENNNRRIKLLEKIVEELYKEWFIRLHFPAYETTELENGLPKGWEYMAFSRVYSITRGVSYSSEEIEHNDGENLINLKNIKAYGGFKLDGTKKYNGKYNLEQKVGYKDLVMGVTDMTQDRRTVGSVALIPSMEGVISADLVKLNSRISNIFSYCLFKFGRYSTYISQFGNGANVIHLKPDSIKNVKLLIPSSDVINLFIQKVEPIIDKIDLLNQESDNLIHQRNRFLPRLMSGKLEV